MALSKALEQTLVTEPALLGDHLAMDLLNTEARVDGRVVDYWRSADDVLRWLDRNGIRREKDGQEIDGATFLASAVALRAIARELIERRKAGETGRLVDAAALNVFLHGAVSVPHLDHDSDGNLVLTRRSAAEGTAHLLGALAEAVAQLLVDGQFDLVRQCEHPECILWFYDRTKSHKRRWCSMALCGNRYKAAQFRKRSQDAA